MNTRAVYKFHYETYRSGDLEGLFTAYKSEVEYLLKNGIEIHFGEVLGKHSDVSVIMDDTVLWEVSDDLAAIKIIEDLNLESGVNPVDRYEWNEQIRAENEEE